MEEGVELTKVFVKIRMFLKQNSVDLKLEFVQFFALLVVIHSHSELVAVVSEIIWDIEGLGKALGVPILPWLSIDVERDHATSQILFNRDRIFSSFEEDWEVFAMDRGPNVSVRYRVAYLRRLNLFFKLRQVVKWCLIHGESVFECFLIEAKCESGTSKGIHFERHRSLFECRPTHSIDTKWKVRQL